MKRVLCLVVSVILIASLFAVNVSAETVDETTAETYGYIMTEYDKEYKPAMVLYSEDECYIVVITDGTIYTDVEYEFHYVYADYDTIYLELYQYDLDYGAFLFKVKSQTSEILGGLFANETITIDSEPYIIGTDCTSAKSDYSKGVNVDQAFLNNTEQFDSTVLSLSQYAGYDFDIPILSGMKTSTKKGSVVFSPDSNDILGFIGAVEDGNGMVYTSEMLVETFPCLAGCYRNTDDAEITTEDDTDDSEQDETTRRKTTRTTERTTTTPSDDSTDKKIVSGISTAIVFLLASGIGILIKYNKDKKKEKSAQQFNNGMNFNQSNVFTPPVSNSYTPTAPFVQNNTFNNTPDNENMDAKTEPLFKTEPVKETKTEQMGKVTLLGKGGAFDGKTIESTDSLYIGRHPKKCSICYELDEKGIGGIHCKVEKDGNGVLLTDLGTTYGTYTAEGRLAKNQSIHLNPGEAFWLTDVKNSFIVQ